MSFLLRAKNRQRNRAAGPSNPLPRSKPVTIGNSKPTATIRSYGSGQVQQLVQRQKPQVHQMSAQRHTSKPQQRDLSQQAAVQEIISMEEVMEDLRVLEQQQRESQRKLATIKLTKQHKQTQKVTLETKLASLKYANGQRRAQLTRARDVLHRSACQMGSAKLRSDKSGANLKDFDEKLKIALASTRSMQVLRRKIDGGLVHMRNKDSVIKRLILESLEQVRALEKEEERITSCEQSFRQKILENNQKTNMYLEDITKFRLEISGLEDDLASAKHMEASTKLRAESIAAEIESEDKRHFATMQAMSEKLQEAQRSKCTIASQTSSYNEELVRQTHMIHMTWMKVVEIQKEEGQDLSYEPVDGSPIPTLDVDGIRLDVEALDQELMTVKSTHSNVIADSEHHVAAMITIRAEYLVVKEEINAIRKEAESTRARECERCEKYKQYTIDLDAERKSVDDLHISVSELRKAKEDEKTRLEQRLINQAEAIQNAEAEQVESLLYIAEDEAVIESLKASDALAMSENAAKITDAKQNAENARSMYECVCVEAETFKEQSKKELHQALDDIERAQNIMIEESQSEIVQMCTRYTRLTELDISYDPEKTLDDQIELVLRNLKTECDARIATADQEVRKREHAHKLHEAKKREMAAEQGRLVRLQKAEEEANKKDRAARKKLEKEAKVLEVAEQTRLARLRRVERESKEKDRELRKRLDKKTKELEASEQLKATEQKGKEKFFLECEKTEIMTRGLEGAEQITQMKLAQRKEKDFDRVTCKKFQIENKSRELVEKRRAAVQKKSRQESIESGRHEVSKDANKLERTPQKLSEQGLGDKRKHRHREEAMRRATSILVEVSNSVEDKSRIVYSSDEESVDMGCFTQREGLRVPEARSNSKEIEELPRSHTRVHWERTNNDAFTNADIEKSFTNTSSSSNIPVSSVTLDCNPVFDDANDEGLDDELEKTYEAPIRGIKGRLAYGSSRGKENSSLLKGKTASYSSYGDVTEKLPYSSTTRISSLSHSDRQPSSQDKSHVKCKKPTSSSSQSRRKEIDCRANFDEAKRLSTSDRHHKRYKTSLPQESSLNRSSKSSLLSLSGLNRISSSKKAMNDQSDLPLIIGRKTSNSATSLRRKDDGIQSIYSGQNVVHKLESSSSTKVSSTKRSRDPDSFGYTQTSGISSGERTSLPSKPRRRKKAALDGNIIAASIGDSRVNRVKSQKKQLSLGGFGGIGDYDFAF